MERMTIRLTPAAFARTRKFLERDPDAIGLRFGVTKSGCSGWKHFADITNETKAGDTEFQQDGIRIFVDDVSLPIVDGTEIDIVMHRLGEQFVFRNPQAKEECGCGESFTTQDMPELTTLSRELPTL